MKYENGYLPKIQYWNTLLEKALSKGDIRMAEKASMKLRYFTDRQLEVYGREKEQLRAYGGQLRGDALLKAIGFFEKS